LVANKAQCRCHKATKKATGGVLFANQAKPN
jgi:hypothetical protein